MDATQSHHLCECGCGQLAGVYKGSNSAAGIVAGQPKRFIHGHHSRLAEYQHPGLPFDERYEVTGSGCWRWLNINAGEDGYGRYWHNGRKIRAHRYSYERTYGPIPRGVHIDHLCHDPRTCPGGSDCPHRACVNPDHLAIASHAANCRRGANSRLNYDQAAEIRRRFASGELGVALAAEFGVRPTTISMVVRNQTWREGSTR